MIDQKEIALKARNRGFWLITDEIVRQLPELPKQGLLNLFIKHTSCALCINENFDPAVRDDMTEIYDRLIKENESYYTHVDEGADDMPSHAKSTLTGVSLNIPITNGHLNMGTWQGIYLCEFRNYGGSRKVVMTIIS
ncbi:MAG: secondary thiamine-phosphate synthase enzyme YjbQ [Paludibacteraceae bacterium]|nr:secondary thiamine-phosphate synthase enzyme YjbQ [Paludibacteraceae bacterium]